MSRLKVRCFGGLDVWVDGVRGSGFESYRTRALFAYLACQRERAFSRDHLSGLLWPDRDEQSARRNLRQALYNIKNQVAFADSVPLIVATDGNLQLNPELESWVDVEEFSQALKRGFGEEVVDVQELTRAVGVYRGDFLSDFPLKESPELELWILTEQESYREQALQALRRLVESYLNRGEFRIGVQFAQRLIAIDPLSESAHRQLIRFYSLSGRRSQAIQAYENLREVLASELGVEPLAETTALYESTLTRGAAAAVVDDGREAIGPLIPMVGRSEPYRQLGDDLRFVSEGRALITLLAGEAGVGKSRLSKSYLGAVSARRGVTVLTGHCFGRVQRPYQPFDQLMRNALLSLAPDEAAFSSQAWEQLAPAARAMLLRLVPDLPTIRPELEVPSLDEAGEPFTIAATLAEALTRLSRPSSEEPAEPMILFIEDLHHAGCETFEVLQWLVGNLRSLPLWILATCDPAGVDESLREELFSRPAEDSSLNVLYLERLAPAEVEEIALALVSERQAPALTSFLIERGGGLPLQIAEWINVLWGEGSLTLEGEGRWRLVENAAQAHTGETSLEDLVKSRLARLPNSARRLAALAAVIGPTFDSEVLAEAGDEHPTVVEVALELMLERWLVRKSTGAWVVSLPEQDIALWQRGARRGRFEFSHEALWRTVYKSVNPLRQQVMHREVAAALQAIEERTGLGASETTASHWAIAGEWDATWPLALVAARRSRALGAENVALHYYDLALKSLSALLGGRGSRLEVAGWKRERDRIQEERETTASTLVTVQEHGSRA